MDDAILKMVRDESVYPQASSYDPETRAPGPLLAQREAEYQRVLGWDDWQPGSLLDVGAGKGFHLGKWPSAKVVQAIEPDARMVPVLRAVAPGAAVLNGTFISASIDLVPADLVLCLRCPHYLFWETYSHLWIIKMAMLCKHRLVMETSWDLEYPTINELYHRYFDPIAAVRSDAWIQARFSEETFWRMAAPYFRKVTESVSACGYRTILLERIMPEIRPETNPAGTRIAQSANTWEKTGYTEAAVMRYLTILQALGRSEIIEALTVVNGALSGIVQVDLGRKEGTKAQCGILHQALGYVLMPIGYQPWDIVPMNMRQGIPIDVDIALPINAQFDNTSRKDAFVRALLHDQGMHRTLVNMTLK